MPTETKKPRSQSYGLNDAARERWRAWIEPIVEWCNEERGRRRKFVQAVKCELIPFAPTRQAVEYWIHPEEIKRKQPPLAHALTLLVVAQKLRIGKPPRKPRTTKPKPTPQTP